MLLLSGRLSEFEEKIRLHRLTKQCANKCQANLEHKSWKSREDMFKTKDPRRFKVPSNQPSLGDRLLHKGELTSDPVKVQESAFAHFEYIPSSLLTGIIRPIYKGKDKDLSCHSYRGMTMTSVVMKVWE